MSRTLDVAFATFKETARRKVFLASIAFSLLIFFVPLAAIPLASGQKETLVKDIGLSFIEIFSVLLAVVTVSSLVHDEIERRTVVTVLARSIRRRDYLFGKYLGLLLMSAANIAIMTAGFAGILTLALGHFELGLLAAVGLAFLQVSVVTAVAVLFTTVSSGILATCATLFFFVAGHLLDDLRAFGEQAAVPATAIATRAISYVLPNLGNFDAKGEVVYGAGVSAEHLLLALVYGAGYASVLVILSGFLFEKREFR